ncbi:hypothetical protein HDU88_002176 [Geranomyces variabilis]|nr:hypothetical protein HDU88_002176 [Geranomyces variabilis]
MVKKRTWLNKLKGTFSVANGLEGYIASEASVQAAVCPHNTPQPPPPPLQRATSTTLFTGTLLSVSAYTELPTLTKLLHPRTRANGVVSRKLRVRLEVSSDRIREYALGLDGRNGLLLAEMDRDWVGFAILGIKKHGRCRFALSDNHQGDEEDGLKRVYEVPSRKELAIWSAKLSQPPDDTQTVCTTAASVLALKYKANSLYSTELELPEGESARVPFSYDEDEYPWISHAATACEDEDRWISTLAVTYEDSDTNSRSSGWNANDAEWETSPPQPDAAGAQSSHSSPCSKLSLKPYPPSGAPPLGPLSPRKLRARSRATLKSDVVCEAIENQRGLGNLTRMQGRVGSLMNSLHWLNKQWTNGGTT